MAGLKRTLGAPTTWLAVIVCYVAIFGILAFTTAQNCELFSKEYDNDRQELRDAKRQLRSQLEYIKTGEDPDLVRRIREVLPQTRSRVAREYREWVDSEPPSYCL